MSEAFLMRRGGKKDVLDVGVALICAKFPTGSTCACEKDGRRLSSDSASGVAAFSVPEAGTWTLTITDGEQTASDTVTVAAGDVKIVTLAYTPTELVILDGTTLASGYSWQASGQGSSSLQDGGLVVEGAGYLSPAIDLGNYSTLTIKGMTTYTPSGDSRIFVDDSNDTTYGTGFDWYEDVGTTEETFTIDLETAGLSGANYIGQAAGSNTFKFTSIVIS